jgi:hypothetical protein
MGKSKTQTFALELALETSVASVDAKDGSYRNMLEQRRKKMTRMDFLQFLGASSASFLVLGLFEELFADVAFSEKIGKGNQNGSDAVTHSRKKQYVVYHTSTRKKRACHACKNHALNKIFSSREAAEKFRAHTGCNCSIVEEKINRRNYVVAFWPNSKGGTKAYDKRWGWPPPLPQKRQRVI